MRAGLGLWLAVSMAIGSPAPTAADDVEVYRWVDDDGTVHHSSGIERVPDRFRPTAESMTASPSPEPLPPSSAPPAAPPGTGQISFTPGSSIVVSVRIGGLGPISLILDTGADRTLVSPAALRALGIPVQPAGRAHIRGVAGSTEAELIWIPSLEVESARTGPLSIVALDAGIGAADGLLGRDFLDRFRVTIDGQVGIVTLAPLP